MSALLRDAIYGLAIGDALGVPYEFNGRESFSVSRKMVGGGTHGQPAGTWSDDTSMTLATCDSIRLKKGIDVADMRQRFNDWYHEGSYAIDHNVFDIGTTVSTALYEGRGCSSEYSNGNGSLMRIAPLAFAETSNADIAEVSSITHAHQTSIDACITYVHILRDLVRGLSVTEAIGNNLSHNPLYGRIEHIGKLKREEVHSSGYVVDTLEASLWCLVTTDSFEECVMSAVDLGSDTDTTGAAAGALAGVVYGIEGMPQDWMDQLRGKDVIEGCLFCEPIGPAEMKRAT